MQHIKNSTSKKEKDRIVGATITAILIDVENISVSIWWPIICKRWSCFDAKLVKQTLGNTIKVLFEHNSAQQKKNSKRHECVTNAFTQWLQLTQK